MAFRPRTPSHESYQALPQSVLSTVLCLGSILSAVTLREDDSRVRKDNAPENMAMIRHITLNMLQNTKKQYKDMSIKRLQKKAGWGESTIDQILTREFSWDSPGLTSLFHSALHWRLLKDAMVTALTQGFSAKRVLLCSRRSYFKNLFWQWSMRCSK